MVIFDNCKIISNGNAILIRDYRFQYDNDYRLKDSISFINTEVNGFLVGYAQHAARNGYHFTVSNSSVDGIIGAQYLADYTFPLSYTIFSLPLFNNIRYLNNLSGRNLKAGSLVKMEYDAKEYYWNIDDRVPVVIGFNIDEVDCDAILLSGVSSDGSAHILMSGVGRIGDWYEIDCSAGDYIRMVHNKLTTSLERTNIVYLGERYVRISR